MWTILALVIVVIPNTANAQVTKNDSVGGNVLLPCHCPTRDRMKGVYWQKDPEMIPILRYENKESKPQPDYSQRATILLTESNNNCSLLLSNISRADAGVYKCTFYNQDYPEHCKVTLNISASFSSSHNPFVDNKSEELDTQSWIVISSSVTIAIFFLALVSLVLYRFLRARRNMEKRDEEVIYCQMNALKDANELQF